jgi:LDH2 family malate/lactate/ureidoglycolate dehydrogenase
MRLTIDAARTLVDAAMRAVGHDADDAALIADHLIDCELRGVTYGGLPRALSIAERMMRSGPPRESVRVEKDTAVSARLDGGDRIGYVVAHRATRIAIDKALAIGIAIVGARNTWYTGMLSYYAEMAAKRGLVTMIASNATPWVAPHGASEGRVGTNPICFGFPGAEDPVIWDIGTSAIMHAEVKLAQRLGLPLRQGAAFDADGRPTTAPADALDGAFAAWGGHKGSGLAMVVQMLGGLAGGSFSPPELADFGFLIVAIRPDLLTDADAFASGVTAFAADVRAARPVAGGDPVRMPFDRSREERRRRRREDAIDVETSVYSALLAISTGRSEAAGQP